MEKLRLLLEEAQGVMEIDPSIKGKIIDSSTATTPSLAYITSKFILQVYSEEKVTVSFTINSYKIQKVADLMHLLTLFFYDSIKVVEDNYVDTANEEIYYGSAAYDKFQEDIHTKKGYTRCPICEKLATKELWLADKGYCVVCEQEEIPYMTFH